VYMDDILIFSGGDREEHLRHVRMVLATLRHHRLFAKASKCAFGRSSVAFLGHVISAAGVAVDPRKTAAVSEWATPASCTDVRRFVGLANYYRKFVDRFANLAAPLTALCSPRARFHWGETEQRSFDALKRALTAAPVLRVWDSSRATRLITDASELAVGSILEQPDDQGAWHPVAFESRKLTIQERSYPPHRLELLAVVHSLRAFRPYLLDKPFELHTDNASLQWLNRQRLVSHHHARWLDTIGEFAFTIIHIPGRTNPADFLSRMRFSSGTEPAPTAGYTDDGRDEDAELFVAPGSPAAAFAAVSADPAAPRFLRPDFASALRDALLADTAMGELARAARTAAGAPVSSAGLPVSRDAPVPPSACFIWRHDLLYRRSASGDRLCIPAADGLRGRVLDELHATPLGGHFGRDKTMALARRLVWWPRLAADVTAFIASCPTCQRTKAEHGPPAGLLFPLPVPSRRGGTVSLDFLELPKARSGHNFMQVHVDLLTGRVWLVPTFKSATSEVAARNFVASVFRDVGLPDTIVSDRDCRFTAEFWTSLHRALGSTLIFGSPEHHNTTSKVERVNGVIADVLRAFVNDRQDNWPELTPLVEFAINDAASPLGTGFTPFFADRGQHPRRPLAPPTSGTAPEAKGGKAVALLMGRVTAETRALLQERQDARKARLDPRRRDVRFAPGDQVLLNSERTPLPSRGLLSPRWVGPFTVLAQTAPNTYRLELPPAWKVVNEFNVDRLRRFRQRPDGTPEPPPRIDPLTGDEEREVQEILGFRVHYGAPQCLIRWAGKDASGDTWEPVEHLTHCEEALQDFEAARGVAVPRPPPSARRAAPSQPPPLPPPPSGFSIAASAPDGPPAGLVGSKILYWWPEDGWLLGSVAKVSSKPPFSHVVAYHAKTSPGLAGTVDSLLDSTSYGQRWLLLAALNVPSGLRRSSRHPAAGPAPGA